MKGNKLPRTDLRCKLKCMLIGAMPPANTALIFFIAVLRIVDQKISLGRKIKA